MLQVPNLSRYDNMAEYLAGGGGAGSESEGEDDENSHCVVPQLTNQATFFGFISKAHHPPLYNAAVAAPIRKA